MKLNILAIQLIPVFFQLYLAIEIISIKDIVIVVINQNSNYHQELTNDLIKTLNNQIDVKNEQLIRHNVTSNYVHDWTLLPVLPKLATLQNFSWILICEERTRINFKNLRNTLSNYDSEEKIWFGQELYDEESTIIHHYAFYENSTEFKYPNLAAGFVLSKQLFNQLLERFNKESISFKVDFSIDASHEFALFVWDKGNGISFKHDKKFCIQYLKTCATYVLPFTKCSKPISNNNIYYAIKTCTNFHQTRIPVIKNTWGKYAEKIEYFSDTYDPSIPTFKQDTPNVKEGHCEKTKEILVLVSKISKEENIDWLVIADDDTILSIGRLNEYLSCFDSSEQIVLGQRYGYDVIKPNSGGFNYVTGGGGVVISKMALEKLVAFQACDCPSHTTPDDMYLFGVCLAQLNIPIVHSSMFHQARPSDYANNYLKTDKPISFHKHWMINPTQVYEEWFLKDDLKWGRTNSGDNLQQIHIEL